MAIIKLNYELKTSNKSTMARATATKGRKGNTIFLRCQIFYKFLLNFFLDTQQKRWR
jgi:hypothetical protein